MRRDEFRDALRRAAVITGDRDLVVVGSQSIHGAFSESVLRAQATASMEVDLIPLHDPEGDKFWFLSAIGGLYADLRSDSGPGLEIDGVELKTSVLPDGWADRLIPFPLDDSADTVIGWCLDPHDLVVAKAVAGRDKDREFIVAAVKASLVDPAVALSRMGRLDPLGAVPSPERASVAAAWLAALRSPGQLHKTASRRAPRGRARPKPSDFPTAADIHAGPAPPVASSQAQTQSQRARSTGPSATPGDAAPDPTPAPDDPK
jgi:hypothetical protein